MSKRRIFAIGIFLISVSNFLQKASGQFNSYDRVSLKAPSTLSKKGFDRTSIDDYFNVYRKYISGVRGQSCPMYPSCSVYGQQQFVNSNFGISVFRTFDRLIRCGHDSKNYFLTYTGSSFKFLDYSWDNSSVDSLIADTKDQLYSYRRGEDSLSKIVSNLMNEKFYNEAILLLKIKETQSALTEPDIINYYRCLRYNDRLEDIIFRYHYFDSLKTIGSCSIIYEVLLTKYKLGDYEEIISSLNDIQFSDTLYDSKMLVLKGLSFAQLGEWRRAEECFVKVSDNQLYTDRARKSIDQINIQINFKEKKPLLGGVLSIIPGLGYAYAGHPQSAVSSLVVIGLFSYASYTSFNTQNSGLGVLLGAFGGSFYISNIIGAINSVKRYNSTKKLNSLRHIESLTIFD